MLYGNGIFSCIRKRQSIQFRVSWWIAMAILCTQHFLTLIFSETRYFQFFHEFAIQFQDEDVLTDNMKCASQLILSRLFC